MLAQRGADKRVLSPQVLPHQRQALQGGRPAAERQARGAGLARRAWVTSRLRVYGEV